MQNDWCVYFYPCSGPQLIFPVSNISNVRASYRKFSHLRNFEIFLRGASRKWIHIIIDLRNTASGNPTRLYKDSQVHIN